MSRTNIYSGYIFSNMSETTQSEEETDVQQLFPFAKQSFFTRLYSLYPLSAFNSTFFQRQTLYGDFIITCPTYYMATATSDYGLPVYKLIFDAGAQTHGATRAFLGFTPGDNGNNATLSLIMKDWFISFTQELDPNTVSYSNASKPNWPLYQTPGTDGFSVMSVNYTEIGARSDYIYDATDRCDFFHGQSYVVRN